MLEQTDIAKLAINAAVSLAGFTLVFLGFVLAEYRTYPGDAGGVKTPYKKAAWALIGAFVLGLLSATALFSSTSTSSCCMYRLGFIGLAVQGIIVVISAAAITKMLLD